MGEQEPDVVVPVVVPVVGHRFRMRNGKEAYVHRMDRHSLYPFEGGRPGCTITCRYSWAINGYQWGNTGRLGEHDLVEDLGPFEEETRTLQDPCPQRPPESMSEMVIDDINESLPQTDQSTAPMPETKPPENQSDPVNSPSHYQGKGGMEVIDAMVGVFGAEAVAIHCRLCAFKYISRCMDKGKPVQDLEKAGWYCEKAAELME